MNGAETGVRSFPGNRENSGEPAASSQRGTRWCSVVSCQHLTFTEHDDSEILALNYLIVLLIIFRTNAS
jgi:hypothetical protein